MKTSIPPPLPPGITHFTQNQEQHWIREGLVQSLNLPPSSIYYWERGSPTQSPPTQTSYGWGRSHHTNKDSENIFFITVFPGGGEFWLITLRREKVTLNSRRWYSFIYLRLTNWLMILLVSAFLLQGGKMCLFKDGLRWFNYLLDYYQSGGSDDFQIKVDDDFPKALPQISFSNDNRRIR